MRSIGKKNRELVKEETRNAIKGRTDFLDSLSGSRGDLVGIDQEIIDKLPEELWDTWEGAHSEIKNLIHDTICND